MDQSTNIATSLQQSVSRFDNISSHECWDWSSNSAIALEGDVEIDRRGACSTTATVILGASGTACNGEFFRHKRESELLLHGSSSSSVYRKAVMEAEPAQNKLSTMTRLVGSAFHNDYVVTQVTCNVCILAINR